MVAKKKTDILLLDINFPNISSDREPKGNYLYEIARSLSEEAGIRIKVLAFRFAAQPSFEERNGLSVKRIEIPCNTDHYISPDGPTWDDLQAPRVHKIALSEFAEEASLTADSIGHIVPLWCHGFMTVEAGIKLRKKGYPVVGVSHGLVAEELMQRLEITDDPLRKRNFPRTISSVVGALCPKKLRPSLVRLLKRSSTVISRLPIPTKLELLYMLAIESTWMNTAHIIVAVSPSHADSIARYHPYVKDKLRYCVAGAPAPSSKSYWPFPNRDDRLRLIMVGRASLEKGWDYVAAALKNFESKYPQEAGRLEFVSIGYPGRYGTYIDRAIQSLNELKIVSFSHLGGLPHEEVMEVMSAADALLLPSVFESFGLVLVEAMANGCMVLASDADGPRDVVKSPWGMLMNFQDPEMRVSEIERGILELLSLSRDQIKRLGEKARKASLDYSWKKCANAHSRALESAGAHVNA